MRQQQQHKAPSLSTSLAVVLFSWSLLVLQTATQQQDTPTLLWSDEFEGPTTTPDPSIWSFDVGGGGWGNYELQVYTSTQDNARVEDGLLKIIARRDDTGTTPVFTSARVKTENRMSFTYGTLEARIKVPDMDAGLWPAFWTLGNNYYQVGWPNSGEVDIMEMGQGLAVEEGVVNRRVVSAAHWDMFGQYASYAQSYDAAVDLTQGYHVYKLEWTPEKMATYVDGNWIWEMDINTDNCPSCDELHQPHFVLFNLAVGGGFTSGATSSSSAGASSSSSSSSSSCTGSSSSAASTSSSSSSGGCPTRGPEDITAPLPGELLVDWVRLYDNGFTEISAPPTPSPTRAPVAPTQPPVTQAQETPAPVTQAQETPAPVTQAPRTPAPVLPVTNPPITPATQSPRTNPPVNPVNPVVPAAPGPSRSTSGKAGKGGKGGHTHGGLSRSETSGATGVSGKGGKGKSGSGGSRVATSGGKGKGGKSGSLGSRTATAGVSGKGKGGKKGRYSRSGETATGLRTETAGPVTQTSTTPAPTTDNRNPTDGEFVPEDEDGETRTVPSSLVVEPRSRSAAWSPSMLISMALSGLVTLGLLTSTWQSI